MVWAEGENCGFHAPTFPETVILKQCFVETDKTRMDKLTDI